MLKKLLLSLAGKSGLLDRARTSYVQARNAIRRHHHARINVDERTIIFESFHSKQYVDSPKAIYEYMVSNPKYNDYKFIWSFQDPKDHPDIKNNRRTKIVKHESGAYFRAFAKAKYWVVNGWISLDVKKRPGQVMLQCWHGTPLKRLRYDIAESVDTHHRRADLESNDTDVRRYDYFISPSKFATKVFTSAFNLRSLKKQDIIIETGYPRNDFLYTFTPADVKKVKSRLNIPKNKKVLLYAPTWRDDQHIDNVGYVYNTPVDFDSLQKKLADEYVILFRTHSIASQSFNFQKYQNFIIDVSDYDDINDLYIISDVLMTDYSSVFFDYANLKRPLIFFMYDLEHYQNDLRGFYVDLKTLPGDIVKTEAEVSTILKDLSTYQKKHQKTYVTFSKTYNYLDDGGATERVVQAVLE